MFRRNFFVLFVENPPVKMSRRNIFPPKSSQATQLPRGQRRATGQKCWRIYGTSLSGVGLGVGDGGEEEGEEEQGMGEWSGDSN